MVLADLALGLDEGLDSACGEIAQSKNSFAERARPLGLDLLAERAADQGQPVLAAKVGDHLARGEEGEGIAAAKVASPAEVGADLAADAVGGLEIQPLAERLDVIEVGSSPGEAG